MGEARAARIEIPLAQDEERVVREAGFLSLFREPRRRLVQALVGEVGEHARSEPARCVGADRNRRQVEAAELRAEIAEVRE